VAALRLGLTTGSAGRVGTQADLAGANCQGRSPPLGALSRQERRGGTPCRSLRYGGLLRRSAAAFSSSCVAWAVSVIALPIYLATPAVASTVWARLILAEFCSCLAEAARSRTAGRPALPAMAGTESVPAAWVAWRQRQECPSRCQSRRLPETRGSPPVRWRRISVASGEQPCSRRALRVGWPQATAVLYDSAARLPNVACRSHPRW